MAKNKVGFLGNETETKPVAAKRGRPAGTTKNTTTRRPRVAAANSVRVTIPRNPTEAFRLGQLLASYQI